MSNNIQFFTIAHELYHFKTRFDITIWLRVMIGRELMNEFKADEYATTLYGRDIAINALREFKRVALIPGIRASKTTQETLDKRIENIMKLGI